MRVVALAGGVGGAKLVHGLAACLPPKDLTVIVNTADDFEHFGLHISPDLDTVCYTLAGLANSETGWGLIGDTWNALRALERLGAPLWFQLGDGDLATHLERTRRLNEGQSLGQVVERFCMAWHVQQLVLPMTNDPVRTIVQTNEGDLEFQEYFVHRRCEPRVEGFKFDGIEAARAAPGVMEALAGADVIILCPSNPWVSIGPILAIPGLRSAIHPGKAIAVSPIIAGRAVRGPAAKMYAELGIQPSALAVAKHYSSIITKFVVDLQDAESKPDLQGLQLQVLATQTLMITVQDRARLARAVLDFSGHHQP